MFTSRKTVSALTTGVLSMIAAGAVQAQTAEPFTGPYVAAIGGWDRAQADHGHKDGFVYGGNAGYDFAAGKVRFGPVVEVTGSTEKGCATDQGATACMKAGRDFFIGGRVGLVAAPKALVYVTGGYTNARYTGDIAQGTTRISTDDDHSGGRIGAGVEYAVTRNLFVKTEYRYSRYSDSIARNQVIGGIGYRF
jgi:outer membrane immunogenic protein